MGEMERQILFLGVEKIANEWTKGNDTKLRSSTSLVEENY